jgi:large subunit ribosomal protein L30
MDKCIKVLHLSFCVSRQRDKLPTVNDKLIFMKKIKITLVKSPIDKPERQKQTLKALGLNKTNSVREVDATAQILGMVRKVGHLVKVEEV